MFTWEFYLLLQKCFDSYRSINSLYLKHMSLLNTLSFKCKICQIET
jgi:hypothetical protein